ncbi:MAG TPA: EAL domain-containing protein [Actinomycetes bacterium]|nr:EAL domain-containing protein [Actinomycetes bacterium]
MTTTDPTAATAVAAATLDDEQARSLVVNALHAGAPTIVVQPILGLTTGRAVAYEALSRFDHGGPHFPPDQWFAMAHQVELGAMFEARAVDLAMRLGNERPSGTTLSVNVSPSVLSSRELHDVLPFDLSGLQFEITEKEVVDDPAHLAVILDALRSRGARIAVDDVGEGYAGLQRVMSISPDILKLDRSLVTGVEAEPGKAAMIDAIVRYAAKVGAKVCAEGVESLDDLYVLADLDVAEAQGWVIGMPSPSFEAASEASKLTCESSFARALSVGGRSGPRHPTSGLEHLLGRIVDTQDLDSLARLMGLVAETMKCDKVELSYLDPTGEFLEAVRPDAWEPEGVRYYLSEYAPTAQALGSQQILQVVANDPGADTHEVAWMRTEGVQTLIGVPIVCAGQPIGFLECCKVDETPWSRMQLRHARIIASVLGPVLGNLQPHDAS